MNKIYISIICSFFIIANVFAASDISDNPTMASEPTLEVNTADLSNRLTTVEDKSNAMQTQINQLDERINSIEQKMGQPVEHGVTGKENFFEKIVVVLKPVKQYIDKIALSLGIDPKIIILIIGIVVLLLIYLLFRRSRSASHAESMPPKDEYNFMENKEGIVSKLNLARAYIAMGKIAEAQVLLQEVIVNGNQVEQNDARELLRKIPQ